MRHHIHPKSGRPRRGSLPSKVVTSGFPAFLSGAKRSSLHQRHRAFDEVGSRRPVAQRSTYIVQARFGFFWGQVKWVKTPVD